MRISVTCPIFVPTSVNLNSSFDLDELGVEILFADPSATQYDPL